MSDLFLKSSLSVLVTVLTLSCNTRRSSHINTGTEFGNGAGGGTFAWFADAGRPVRYCIGDIGEFPYSAEEFSGLVADAVQAWKEYLATRQTIARINSLQYTYEENCHSASDLMFFIGSGPDTPVVNGLTIKDITASHQGAAISYRLQELPGWAKGIIWISPKGPLPWNSAEGAGLRATLVHEIGHVLGSDHVGGTIMNFDLEKVVAEPGKKHAQLASIDWDAALAKPVQYQGFSSPLVNRADEPVRAALLQELLGRPLEGALKVEWIMNGTKTARFTLIDEKGAAGFDLRTLNQAPQTNPGSFRVRLPEGADQATFEVEMAQGDDKFYLYDEEQRVFADNNFGRTAFQLKTAAKSHRFEANYNSFGSPLVVYYIQDGKKKEFFRAITPHDRQANPARPDAHVR